MYFDNYSLWAYSVTGTLLGSVYYFTSFVCQGLRLQVVCQTDPELQTLICMSLLGRIGESFNPEP